MLMAGERDQQVFFERRGPGRRDRVYKEPESSATRIVRSGRFIEGLTFPSWLHPERNASAARQARDGLFSLYTDLSEQAGPIDFLFYPGGSGDIYPLHLTNNLVIVDRVPLINPAIPSSQVLYAAMADAGRTFSMRQALAGSRGRDVQQAMQQTLDRVSEAAIRHLNHYIPRGFEGLFGKTDSDDNIADVLAGLAITGIDLNTVRIRRQSRGYKLSFAYEGQTKNIFYLQQTLPDENDSVSTADRADIVRDIAQRVEAKGRIGVLRKADEAHIADNFLSLAPDVYICDTSASMSEDTITHFAHIRPFIKMHDYGPIHQFGYKNYRTGDIDIQIATQH